MHDDNFITTTIEVDGETVEFHRGKSGNIFQDLGFENAAEMTLKADLAVEILRIVRLRGLTQRALVARTGVKAQDVSNIVNARLDKVSVECLFTTLNRLGRNIEIHVASEDREDARTLVCT